MLQFNYVWYVKNDAIIIQKFVLFKYVCMYILLKRKFKKMNPRVIYFPQKTFRYYSVYMYISGTYVHMYVHTFAGNSRMILEVLKNCNSDRDTCSCLRRWSFSFL